MTESEWRAFLLDTKRTAKVATVRADGRPHVAPVWYDLDGGDLVFTTLASSVKGKALLRDPRLSVCVDDENPPFSFVLLDAEAVLVDDPAELRTWATKIAGRYMGPKQAEVYGGRERSSKELLVRARITKVVAQAEIAG